MTVKQYDMEDDPECVFDGLVVIDSDRLWDRFARTQVGYWLISPGQNGRHFADDIFRYIFVNEKFCSLIKTSPKFVPQGPFENNPALV